MRILCISPYVPWPLHAGTPRRIFHILRGLKGLGHRIELLAGVGGGGEAPPRAILEGLCDSLQTFQTRPGLSGLSPASLLSPTPYPFRRFLTPSYRAALGHLLAKGSYDGILVNFLFLAGEVLRRRPGGVHVVVDQHEAEELLWRDYMEEGPLARRAYAALNWAKVRGAQGDLLRRLSAIVSVSPDEAELTRRRSGNQVPVWCVPNGVDTAHFQPPSGAPRTEPRVLLCGAMGVRRNAEAAQWFASRVFPLVRAEVPGATFQIVGSNPPQNLRRLARSQPGVDVTGTVPDVRPYYGRAAVVVAPFRYGAGTKVKVLEALAMGCAVVATPIGARGLQVRHGEHLLIAETPQEFADSVAALWNDEGRRRQLGRSARRLAVESYDWRASVAGLDRHLRSLAQRAPRASPLATA